jgi:hypothetical protein
MLGRKAGADAEGAWLLASQGKSSGPQQQQQQRQQQQACCCCGSAIGHGGAAGVLGKMPGPQQQSQQSQQFLLLCAQPVASKGLLPASQAVAVEQWGIPILPSAT